LTKKFKTAKLDLETHKFLKDKAEEMNCTIGEVVKWAVMSKAKNMSKNASIVQSIALTPAEMEMNKNPLDAPKHKTAKEREKAGYERRHSLDFMTGKRRSKLPFERD